MRKLTIAAILSAAVLASGSHLAPNGSVTATASAAPAPASTDAPSEGAAGLLRQVVLLAAAATGIDNPLKGVEGSLVYLGSKYESDSGGEGSSVPSHRPRAAAPEQTGAGDASSMPPASAGTNGTPIPPLPPGVGGSVVARAPVPPGPQAAAATATYVSGIALAPPDGFVARHPPGY